MWCQLDRLRTSAHENRGIAKYVTQTIHHIVSGTGAADDDKRFNQLGSYG
jgi:hypothetical protein